VGLPILHKDFVIDEYHVYDSHQAGADGLLLIARLVGWAQLRRLVTLTKSLGIEPVVEVNDEEDLAKALTTDTEIIAVNARDLGTFIVDVPAACRLLETLPPAYLKLGFSGVESAKQVREYRAAGAGGVLVGTSLMQAPNVAVFLKGLRG
jgi:indole-3-glycerol phosphate synthase